jgi:hypothetical protein
MTLGSFFSVKLGVLGVSVVKGVRKSPESPATGF